MIISIDGVPIKHQIGDTVYSIQRVEVRGDLEECPTCGHIHGNLIPQNKVLSGVVSGVDIHKSSRVYEIDVEDDPQYLSEYMIWTDGDAAKVEAERRNAAIMEQAGFTTTQKEG